MSASDNVYFNLHKRLFSIKLSGKVREHSDSVFVLPNHAKVEFVVSEPGRQRVLREQRKNVHAYVRGLAYTNKDQYFRRPSETPLHTPDEVVQALLRIHGKPTRVSYNPYKGSTFYNEKTGEPVRAADAVMMWAYETPRVFAWGASS